MLFRSLLDNGFAIGGGLADVHFSPRVISCWFEETLTAMFAGKPRDQQKELLARLERAGAATYRALADGERDAAAKEALLAAALREEENAEVLEKG